ncbi:MAG: SH3 domain-containing protein [Deltaproteobacteria bacterium]|nr:SH3 domain-containing protein [Deltaproteobacteria bacterium]
MDSNSTASPPESSNTPNGEPFATSKSGMLHKIIITVLGVASFAIGFLLVHFVIPGVTAPESEAGCDIPATTVVADGTTAESDSIDENEATQSADDLEDASDEALSPDAPGGLPEVPPWATPDGIRLDGAPLYFKCWVRADDTGSSKECDRLRVLEKRMATRLYVVDECRKIHGSETDLGLLSLGANLNFADNTISFWSGPSSTIAGAQKIGNCVRGKLAGLPLSNIAHKHEKYRIFFSVDFFDIKQREQMLTRLRSKGREVQVTMDKVNVREEPVDGASLGRISSDSKVIFLKKNETKDWCQILTPGNRIGWMICDALKL